MGRRRHSRRAAALGFFLCAFGPAAALASGEPDPLDPLVWDAPPDCPSADEARHRLADRLAEGSPIPEVRAVVGRHEGGYRARIEIRAGEIGTQRELSSPSCETLLDVTTLLAATVAEEASSRSDPAVEPAPEPAIVPPPEVLEPDAATDPPRTPDSPVPAAAPERSEPARSRLVGLYVDARVFTGLGVAPDVDFGGGGVMGITLAHAALEVGGGVGLPRRASIVDGRADVRVSWWTLEARGCGRLPIGRAGRLDVLPCAALLGGGYDTRSGGPALRRTGEARDGWLAAGLGPMLVLRLGRWSGLSGGIEGLAFLRRPGVQIEGPGEVLRVRPLGVRATLGIRVRFSVTDRLARRDVGP